MERESSNDIKTFLEQYEDVLKNIYEKAQKELGLGVLCIDINSNEDGNCHTQYLPLDLIKKEEEIDDILLNQIKGIIYKNEEFMKEIEKSNKIYYCVIDKNQCIFIERE